MKSMAPFTHKQWLLIILQEGNYPTYLLEDTQAAHIIHDNYNVRKTNKGSPEHLRIQRVWPRVNSYSFVIADATGVYSHAAFFDEKSCLQFLLDPHEYGAYDSCTALHYYLLNDIVEGSVQNLDDDKSNFDNILQVKSDEHKVVPKNNCIINIRLMDGSSTKACFDYTDSLLDVKRWLQQELKLLLVPEDDISISRYSTFGHFEPSRYAFFYPATRKTFSEAQEFSRLQDLGLCPRLALILRPDYDELAMKAARDENNSFKKVFGGVTHALQALYSFFDYGVDDASRDIPGTCEYAEVKSSQPPRFLGSAGPAASSASFIKVHESDTAFEKEFDDIRRHTPSRARGESVMNVGREEFFN